MAKKIFALVASVVLVVCFAVTVSAAEVNTTTTYVVGEVPMVDVNVRVSGLTEGTNVTYYATNGSEKVYVNQEKVAVGASSVEFNFTTEHGNVNSAVKVGYTADDTADEKNIPDAAKYAIKYGDETLDEVYVNYATVEFTPTLGDYMSVTGVNATNVDNLTWSVAKDGKVSVSLTGIKGDVVLSVVESAIAIPELTEQLSIVDAAAVVVTADNIGSDDVKGETNPDIIASATANAIGDRKLTVCGKAGTFTEYGIIVSEDTIDEENLRPAAFEEKYANEKYQAATKASDGRFAVQLIDISTTENGTPFVVEGESYNVAVYGYDAAKGAYYVKPYALAVTVQ